MNSKLTKLTQLFLVVSALGFTASNAMSEVKLPKTAKLLNKAEIIVAYGGKTTNYEHPNTDKVIGTAIFSADMTKGNGTFIAGSTKGEWESKITLKKDQYCWSLRVKGNKKFEKPVCNLVYLDGKVAYEVHPKTKQIVSVNTIQ